MEKTDAKNGERQGEVLKTNQEIRTRKTRKEDYSGTLKG